MFRLSERNQELLAQLKENPNIDIAVEIEKIMAEISTNEKRINSSIEENQKILAQLYEKNENLSECNVLLNRYDELTTQYDADLKRLNFIVDGEANLNASFSTHCPFCDGEVVVKKNQNYIDAAKSDYKKIKLQAKDLESASNLYTWGFNRMGLNVIPPELKGKKIADIEAGYQVSVVVTEDGKVVSWGNTSAVDISTANVKDEKVKEVKANIQTAIALTKDGKVISLAKKETALDNVPEEIQGKVEKIALTDKAAAAVLKDGTVKVWGNNHDHIFSVPEEVQGKAVDISGGRNHLVVVTEDGNAVAWGGNENNQAKVPAKATNIAKLASGYYQNCIIKEDGSVVTWGLKGYLLGTDNLGRNVFYRILKGGQMTMTVGFIAVIIQFAIGILVGGISGYYGGTVDILLMRLAEVVGSLPFIPLALILSALIGNKVSDVGRIIMIMLILGFLGWTGIAGLVRAQVLAERNKEFVVAAKALGVKEKNIIFRHIVPNVMTIIIVQATISFATCMLTESGLSFLGFGVAEPIPSWGNMLNNCRSSEVISQYWWRWVFPSVVLGLCTVSINLFGDGLRRAVDPKANER